MEIRDDSEATSGFQPKFQPSNDSQCVIFTDLTQQQEFCVGKLGLLNKTNSENGHLVFLIFGDISFLLSTMYLE